MPRSSCSICRTTHHGKNMRMVAVPKDPEKRQSWSHVCGVELKAYSRICEIHFREDDFKTLPNNNRMYLKDGVIPSLSLFRIKKIKVMNNVNETQDISVQTDFDTYASNHEHRLSSVQAEFPRDESLRQQWINACGLSITDELKNTKICSTHFVQENYHNGGRCLRFGAVPSIGLPGPSKDKVDQMFHSASVENSSSTANKYLFTLPHDVSEITVDDFAIPEHASRILELVQKTVKKKDKLIKSLETNTRYLRKRINSLEKLTAQLREKNCTDTDAEAKEMLGTELNFPPNSPSLSNMKVEIELSETELILPDCLKGEPRGGNFSNFEIKQELLEPEEFCNMTSTADTTKSFSNTNFIQKGLVSSVKKICPSDATIKQEPIESTSNTINPATETLTDNFGNDVKHKTLVLQKSQDESISAQQKDVENLRVLVNSLRKENETLRKENNDLTIDLKNLRGQKFVLPDQ